MPLLSVSLPAVINTFCFPIVCLYSSSPPCVSLDQKFRRALKMLDSFPPMVDKIKCLKIESSFTFDLLFQI